MIEITRQISRTTTLKIIAISSIAAIITLIGTSMAYASVEKSANLSENLGMSDSVQVKVIKHVSLQENLKIHDGVIINSHPFTISDGQTLIDLHS